MGRFEGFVLSLSLFCLLNAVWSDEIFEKSGQRVQNNGTSRRTGQVQNSRPPQRDALVRTGPLAENRPDNQSKVDYTKLKWITEIFAEARMDFHMDPSVSAKCRTDFDLYKLHLKNQSLWAVRMFESSEWPSVGPINGMSYHLGNYDECLLASAYSVQGQYCLVESTYSMDGNERWTSPVRVTTDVPDPKASVWDAITMYRADPSRADRTIQNWAMCLPASCSIEDIKMTLDNLIVPLFDKYQLDINIKIDPRHCSHQHYVQPSKEYYTACYFLGFILLLVLSATLYDQITGWTSGPKNKDAKVILPLRIFGCFSMVKNLKKLNKVDKGTDISVVYFIKVVNILIIIYGHRYIYSVGFPLTNTDAVEEKYKQFSSIELVHANVVDVFFMVSGFLTYYFGFKPMKKAGEIYYPMSILLRWMRMVPVFGIMMIFIIYVMPYIGDGPLWAERVLREVDNCRTTWWANLLAVNNFVNPQQQCLLVSWYISTDIQLCVIGGFLLYLITRYKKVGLIATMFVFLLASGITFTVAYVNHYDGVMKLYKSLLEEPRNSVEFTNFYIATYTRVSPYIVGFFAGFLTATLLERGFTLNSKQVLLVFGTALIIGDGCQYYGLLMYIFGRPYDPIENALYASLNRTLLASTYATFIVLYMTSGLGILNKLIQARPFVPLGRLTYSVFLVNTVVQLYHAASQRHPASSESRMQLIWAVMADIPMSYIFGLFLHLFAEAPISNLTKMLQRKIGLLTIKKIAPELLANGKNNLPVQNGFQNLKSSKKENDVMDKCMVNSSNEKSVTNGYCNGSYVNEKSYSDASHL